MKTSYRLAALFVLVGGIVQAASPAPDPQISLNPTSFVFDVPKGGPNPLPNPLTIKNIGNGQLDWTATVGNYQPAGVTGWLSLAKQGQSTASGKLAPSATVPVDVFVNVGSLDAGTYTATITVAGPVGSNVVTKTADVQMRVSSVP